MPETENITTGSTPSSSSPLPDPESAKAYLRGIDAPTFFDRMLTKLLMEQPSDPKRFFLDYCEAAQAGSPQSLDGEYKPKIQDDTTYMRTKGVTSFVNDWLEDLLREQPAQPLAFHVRWLKARQ